MKLVPWKKGRLPYFTGKAAFELQHLNSFFRMDTLINLCSLASFFLNSLWLTSVGSMLFASPVVLNNQQMIFS